MATNYKAQGTYNDAILRMTSTEAAAKIDEYKKLYEQSRLQGDKAGMDAAHQAAETLRAVLGYSGGSDGSDYIPLTTTSGSGYTPPYSYNNYDDYYNSTGYGSLEQNLRTAADAQIGSSVAEYENYKKSVNRDSDELARQAYIAYMQGMDSLPQQMAAMGYNGGLSETQQVAMSTNYQDRRNQIGMQQQSQLAALDAAIAEARSRGQSNLAAQLADIRSQSLTQWNSYVQQQNNAAREDYWQTLNNAQNQYQWLRQLDNTNYWKQQELDTGNYWKQQDLDTGNYWKQQDLDYKQQQSTQSQSWQQMLFEYQKQQDLLEQQLQQQKLLIERMKLYS